MNINMPKHTFSSNYILLTASVGFFLTTLIIAAIFMFSKDNLIGGIAILILPIPILYLYWVFKSPRIGLISALYANYFAIGLTRYVNAPFGLTVDGLLLLTWISLIFTQFNKKIEWKNSLPK